MPPKAQQCKFFVRVPQCPADTVVAVLGSIPALGEWDAQRALVLQAAQSGLWHGSIEAPQESFEWKYVLMGPDGVVHWERTGKDNRRRAAGVKCGTDPDEWEP